MKPFIEINNRRIGPDHPTYIIAEIGSNHNYNLRIASKMIDEAAECGVDAVKFQTLYADDFISKHITPDEYGLNRLYNEATWREVLQKHLILPFEWYGELVPRIRRCGLDFITTVHSDRSLAFALKHKPDAIKIASMDLTNIPFISIVASIGLPVIISTGMGSKADIERAVLAVDLKGCKNFALMHCVSEYPANYENLNLKFLSVLENAFSRPVGFSDHSLGVVSSIVAATQGAAVIEKHFTLDQKAKGPDHPFALEPTTLKRLVTEVHQAEIILGSTRHQISERERENSIKYRRSIVANGRLRAGEVITSEKFKFQRPGYGIQPYEVEQLVGCTTKYDIGDEQVITWEMVRK
jgi:N-acetylneuraminate synthase/N,N'-diacetyllegionaminate synthase